MSTVSVIIPCYNYAQFLRECVTSVLSQNEVNVHVLIIDDASSDNTPDVAAELTAFDARVEYRRHLANYGHIATYNEGLDWANGDYSVLLSADDLLAPGSLTRAAQLMDNQPEVGFVYGGCVSFNTGQKFPKPRQPSGSGSWQIYNGLDWLELICTQGINRVASPAVVVRTCLQHELGGYRPELPNAGDLEMWMRFAVHAAVGEILDVDQAFYRLHSKNMHTTQYYLLGKDVQQRRAAFDFLFQVNKDLIPGWERLQKVADRSLACDAIWAVIQACYRGKVAQIPVIELVKYAHSSYGGKFFNSDYFRLYLSLCSRFLHQVRWKLRSDNN